jgi:hypothetical protein
MNLADCTPLPGNGYVARVGDLVVVCASAEGDEDLLLSAMDKVAAGAGDGGELVRQVTRAALDQEAAPDWACAGVTAAGALAVLVHGAAVARIIGADGQAVTLTSTDALIPVSRVFTGASVSVTLELPGHGQADTRLRLDGGVVQAGGVMLTTVGGPGAPAAAAAPPAAVAAPPAAVLAPPAGVSAPDEVGVATELPVSEPGRETAPMAEDLVADAAAAPSALFDAIGAEPAPARSAEPILQVPDASADFESVLLILTEDDQAHAAPVTAPPEAMDERAQVDGVYCPQPKIKHFNDPAVAYCRVCGLGMLQQTRAIQKGPRPPLGVLLLDDGMTFRLDADYVVGRDPGMDPDVAAGRARPLQMVDPGGTISRLHLRVALVGWRVQVVDLGSANGSVVHHPGVDQPQRLTPQLGVEIKPGSTIHLGRRSMRFESYLSS